MIKRRAFLSGLIGLMAAPAIVRASSLMPVKAVATERFITFAEYADRIMRPQFEMYSADFKWQMEQTGKDWRFVVRVTNVDLSSRIKPPNLMEYLH